VFVRNRLQHIYFVCALRVIAVTDDVNEFAFWIISAPQIEFFSGTGI